MAMQEELKQQGDFLFKYRSFLPLLLLVIGITVKIYEVKFNGGGSDSLTVKILEYIGIGFGFFGLFIRVFTVGYAPKNTSGRNTYEGQVADVLNTKGIYSLIRNPLYLGNYLMWLAIALLTGNIWFVFLFSLVFWLYYERIIYAEESFLRNKFGKTYLDWAAKVPPFLPKHFKYIKSDISFSWKKAMKKEKNGLAALFVLFFVFETIGYWAENNSFHIEMDWKVIGTIITGIIYYILKFLKRYTSVLNEEGR